jgi:tRNA threonylcarbamoyladenosine biosynthesis protein TsaB
MIVLAIETATPEVGVALANEHGPLAEERLEPGRGHTEALHPAIARLLSGCGIAMSDLSAVAVDIGPGLFTGLRVGLATAQGLALALGIDVVPCTSTEIITAAVAPDEVVAVMDLRRGDIAWQLPESPELVVFGPPGELAEILEARGLPACLAGDGAHRHAELFDDIDDVTLHPNAALLAPPVGALAALGIERVQAHLTVPPGQLEARYLKPPDARANFAVRPTAVATASEK